jgi:hypothetical protein
MWELGNEVKLIARCEHDAVLQVPQLPLTRHLLRYGPFVRQSINACVSYKLKALLAPTEEK